jgi:hypothetical protein
MRPIEDKPEPEVEDGDVAVPANAAVAANVLSGAPPEPDAGTDKKQPADLPRPAGS